MPDDAPSNHRSILSLRHWTEGTRGKAMLVVLSFFYALFLFLTVLNRHSWLLFHLFQGLWASAFLALIIWIARSINRGDIILPKGDRWAVVLFILSMGLQISIVLFSPSLSQDLMRLQIRGDYLLDGAVPYRDFPVNKPPLYIWFVGFIGTVLGTSAGAFRFVFILFNSAVPLLMVLIGERWPKGSGPGRAWTTGPSAQGWTIGALVYSLWPVGILETGMAGHYDPVVVSLTMAAVLFHLRGRSFIAGAMLGAGLALKFYPAVLLPLIFLSTKGALRRVLLLSGFVLVPVLASAPLLAMDPGAVADYLMEQSSGWGPAMSMRYVFDEVITASGLPDSLGPFLIFSLLLGFLYVLFLYFHLKGSVPRSLTLIVFIMAFLTGVILLGYSTLILLAGARGPLEWTLGIVSMAISAGFLIAGTCIAFKNKPVVQGPFRRLNFRDIFRWESPFGRSPSAAALMIFSLVLLSSQFHPWYLLWMMPFALASGNNIAYPALLFSFTLQVNVYPPWELGRFL